LEQLSVLLLEQKSLVPVLVLLLVTASALLLVLL
jgi:hypothetical protein